MSDETVEGRRVKLKSGLAGPPGVGFQSHCVHSNELHGEFNGIDSQTPVPGGS